MKEEIKSLKNRVENIAQTVNNPHYQPSTIYNEPVELKSVSYIDGPCGNPVTSYFLVQQRVDITSKLVYMSEFYIDNRIVEFIKSVPEAAKLLGFKSKKEK